jgi:hypothetical protein
MIKIDIRIQRAVFCVVGGAKEELTSPGNKLHSAEQLSINGNNDRAQRHEQCTYCR